MTKFHWIELDIEGEVYKEQALVRADKICCIETALEDDLYCVKIALDSGKEVKESFFDRDRMEQEYIDLIEEIQNNI